MSLTVKQEFQAMQTRGICVGTIIKMRVSGDNIRITNIYKGHLGHFRFDFDNLTTNTHFEDKSWDEIF